MKKELSKVLKVFFGVGDLGFSLMTAVEMMAFTFFLTEIAQFPLAISTAILLVTSTVDAILSPFYGAVISGMKAMKWGRYRSWLLVGPPLVIVFFTLQFTKIGSDTMAAVLICVGFIVSHIIWNLVWVANVSLITVLAKDEVERGLLASRRMTYTSASNLVSSYTSITLGVTLGLMLKNPVFGFTLTALLMGVLMMIGYYAHFVMTKGYEETSINELEANMNVEEPAKEKGAGAGAMIKNLFLNPPLLVLMVADLAKNMVIFMYFAVLVYQYQYVLQRMDLLTMHILITGISTTVGSYSAAYLIKKLSSRTSVLLASFVGAISFVSAKIFAFDLVPFIISMSVFMFVIGIAYAGFVSLYADTAIYGEWKTGVNATGFIMGLQNLPIKVAVIIRTAIFSAALASGGYVVGVMPADASQQLKDAIANAITLVPAICLGITFVLILFGFRLTKSKVAELQADIENRNNSQCNEVESSLQV